MRISDWSSDVCSSDLAVGTYVDGVYIARPVAGNLDLLDVQRAEVLRGPQGTLFGRNTTGGAINILSNPPTGDFEGSLKAELGNYDQRRLQGVVHRSEERRVGKECVSTLRFRRSTYN